MLDRPESWTAKMVSGKPLITEKQFEKLLANAPATQEMKHHDPVPVVKIFLPHVRWILGWIYPNDRDRAFAVVKWGAKEPEAGNVLLSDIVRSRLVFGDGDDGLARARFVHLARPADQPLPSRQLRLVRRRKRK